jgi:hypothetical protein
MIMMGMDSNDTSLVIILLALMIFVLAMRALGNRRTVTRNTLHGQTTYTIKGYGGVEARGIVEEIHKAEPDAEITTTAGGKTL